MDRGSHQEAQRGQSSVDGAEGRSGDPHARSGHRRGARLMVIGGNEGIANERAAGNYRDLGGYSPAAFPNSSCGGGQDKTSRRLLFCLFMRGPMAVVMILFASTSMNG